jgi:hypothetical protein
MTQSSETCFDYRTNHVKAGMVCIKVGQTFYYTSNGLCFVNLKGNKFYAGGDRTTDPSSYMDYQGLLCFWTLPVALSGVGDTGLVLRVVVSANLPAAVRCPSIVMCFRFYHVHVTWVAYFCRNTDTSTWPRPLRKDQIYYCINVRSQIVEKCQAKIWIKD